jgi:hypothetical protein
MTCLTTTSNGARRASRVCGDLCAPPLSTRQGLGGPFAEIESGKRRLYDPAAVDACLALFRTKGFAFQ